MKSLFVGVDLSKLWLDISVIGSKSKETVLKVDNTISFNPFTTGNPDRLVRFYIIIQNYQVSNTWFDETRKQIVQIQNRYYNHGNQ
jgi:hypothetical protein